MGITEVIQNRAFKQMQDGMEKTTKELQLEFRRIIKNQNEQTLALITLYEGQLALAAKAGVTLPNPRVKMKPEDE